MLACSPKASYRSSKGNENFEGFYQRFHQDSLFQVSRTRFPLDGYSIEGGRIEGWEPEQWVMHKNGLEVIDTSIYLTERRLNPGEVRERIYQAQGGMLIERHFRLIDRRWWMTFYLYVFL